ncbi:MAG: polysaccharide biosynthesis tyrosine autokinase [bacterium]|nr:polysaccharide biosynthesis tyrosine autokinase [bacterium]
MELWKYGRLIWRRKWYLLTMMALVVALIVVKMPHHTPLYRATATVMPSHGILDEGDKSDTTGRDRRMSNLLELAGSKEVCIRTISKLGLSVSPDRLRDIVDIKPRQVEPFSASGTSDTDIIEISVVYPDQKAAPEVANALARSFIAYYQDFSRLESNEARRVLEGQADEARRKLRSAEAGLDRFRRSHGIALPDARGALLEQYGTLMAMREDADVSSRERSARLISIKSQLSGQPENRVYEQGTTNNPAVQALEAKLIDLEMRMANESSIHTSEHPNIIALRREISQVRSQLSGAVRKVFSFETIQANPLHDKLMNDMVDAASTAIAARARVAGAAGAVSRIESRLSGVSSSETTYAALIREVKMAEETYSVFTNRLNEAIASDVNTAGQMGAVKLVDLADTAEGPINKPLNTPVALVFGMLSSLFIGILLVLGLNYLDGSVKDAEEAKSRLKQPLIGEIPRISQTGNMASLPTIHQDHAIDISPFGEAYRLLRTAFVFRCRENNVKAVAVFSPRPHEGRSTAAINLASSLAMSGRKVLLVDADLREPVLHKIFSISNDKGLSSILTGKDTLMEGIRKTSVDNLYLLPSGPLPANPSELLGGADMNRLMADLRQQGEFVLFDTPASLPFTDAALLTSLTDGALEVVGAGRSSLDDHLLAVEQLSMVGTPVIGMLINGVEPEEVRSYNAYRQHVTRPVDLARLKRKAIISTGSTMLALLLGSGVYYGGPWAVKGTAAGGRVLMGWGNGIAATCTQTAGKVNKTAERFEGMMHKRMSNGKAIDKAVAGTHKAAAKDLLKPQAPVAMPVASKGSVELTAKGRCWIKAAEGEKKVFEGVMQTGQIRKWTVGDKALSLRLGDASKVSLKYNGRVVHPAVADDRTAEVIFRAVE